MSGIPYVPFFFFHHLKKSIPLYSPVNAITKTAYHHSLHLHHHVSYPSLYPMHNHSSSFILRHLSNWEAGHNAPPEVPELPNGPLEIELGATPDVFVPTPPGEIGPPPPPPDPTPTPPGPEIPNPPIPSPPAPEVVPPLPTDPDVVPQTPPEILPPHPTPPPDINPPPGPVIV